jgi:hypothetical protein
MTPGSAVTEQREKTQVSDIDQEARDIDRVPAAEPARLLQETEHPFHTEPAYHAGRAYDPTGKKIEQGANSNQHRRIDRLSICRDELFLAGIAEADEHDVRLCVIDDAENGVDLVRLEISIERQPALRSLVYCQAERPAGCGRGDRADLAQNRCH